MDYLENGYYTLKDEQWLQNQRVAGKVLSECFAKIKEKLIPGISTFEINAIFETMVLDNKDCSLTFKGYSGFPAGSCISINKQLVHGIPKHDSIIKEGDIVKVDGGVTYNKAIADMARTYVVGDTNNKYKLLIEYCKKSLDNCIQYINENINSVKRIGDIGNIIKKTASSINAHVITDLTGHSLEEDTPHWFPFVYNTGEKGKGLRLYPGMTLCIEPMMTYGSPKIKVEDDKWTVILEEIGVHFEDTIFIQKDKVELITYN